MRLTIVAGLIMGVSLAINSAVAAHAKAKIVHGAGAARVHTREIAPWYIATNETPLLILAISSPSLEGRVRG